MGNLPEIKTLVSCIHGCKPSSIETLYFCFNISNFKTNSSKKMLSYRLIFILLN